MNPAKQDGLANPLCFDDLKLGQRFVSGMHRIDEAQIKAFAQQFDPQPFHLDSEAAKSTFFHELVASGWHTAAISMRLLVEGGLPIASGCVEGACKNLIKDRMERSGMRWSLEGGEAMIQLRSLYLSGDLDDYWDFHLEQEQLRLYSPDRWEVVQE